MVLYGIAMIFGWSIGIGAQAVSRKTPIYFICSKRQMKNKDHLNETQHSPSNMHQVFAYTQSLDSHTHIQNLTT